MQERYSWLTMRDYADSIGRVPKQVDNTEFIKIKLNKPLSLGGAAKRRQNTYSTTK